MGKQGLKEIKQAWARGEPVGYIMPTALKQLKAGGHAVVGGVSQGFDVPIYTTPQPAEPVKVNAIFETQAGEAIGTTEARVKRVEWQDDGSLTVVIDYWPQPAEPRLDAPAQVGPVRFGIGVKWSNVIRAAQRHHEYMRQPEQEQARMKKFGEAIKAIQPAEPVDETLICTLDGYQFYLGPEYDGELEWDDAKKWCESLGENYELPNRLVMLAICMNEATAALLTEDSYWTSAEFEGDPFYAAWLQEWSSGSPGLQGYASKSHLYRARAVRRCRL